MIDVPHMGDMFKFADVIECEEIKISNEGGGSENIVMLSPYQMDLEGN